MEYRDFGNTGLKVSVLGFGAGHIGSPEMSESDAARLLNTVLDLGINLIDTARSYGHSEKRIGEHLAHRRHEFVLSTKVGYTFQDKEDWSYDATMGTIDEALAALRTDYLDIVHLHSCDRWVLEKGDAVLALERAREQGKVRVIAYSGENEALAYAIESGRFGSLQCSVNIYDQRSVGSYLPPARDRGMGVIAKRPAGNSVWRYHERPEGHGHAIYFDRMLQMKIDPHGLTLNELALRFAAFAPGVDTCISGTGNAAHLAENLRTIEKGPLPDEIIHHLCREFARAGQDWSGLI